MTPRWRTLPNGPSKVILQNDAPISGHAEDAFDRRRIATRMALEAQLAPPDGGYVVALSGPWGSGKTSIMGMIAEIIREDGDNHLVMFNPWMFSSGDDLVARFLSELAAVLGARHEFRGLARKVADYASSLSGLAAFLPVVGGPAAATLVGAQKVMSATGAGPTLETQRKELAAALAKMNGRIVVFIDDMDRLSDGEIHDVVRLVKLVGDLPRVSYVLSFDAQRVAEVLGRDVRDPEQASRRGHDFLEKIVQSQHQVPPLRQMVLVQYMIDHINAAFAPCEPIEINGTDWHNMLGLAVKDLLETPRDAKRIANAMPAAYELFGEEVAIVDLFGLECLRVLEPEIHARLPEIADVLVNDGVLFGLNEEQDAQTLKQFDQVVASARHPTAVRALLGQLFPAARPLSQAARGQGEWRRERREKRVSRPEVFRTYLHAALGEDQIPAAHIEGLAKLTADPPRLATALAAIPDGQLIDALRRMEDYNGEFSVEHAAEAAGVLLDLFARLDDTVSPVLSGRLSGPMVLRWSIGAVIRSAGDEQARTTTTIDLYSRRSDLSSRLLILGWFGTTPDDETRQSDPDHDFMPEDLTSNLRSSLIDAVLAREPSGLLDEPLFDWLVDTALAAEPERTREAVRAKAEHNEFMTALLQSSVSVEPRRVLSGGAVHSWEVFDWHKVADLLGEEYLRARIGSLKPHLPAGLLDAIQRGQPDLPGAAGSTESGLRVEPPPATSDQPDS